MEEAPKNNSTSDQKSDLLKKILGNAASTSRVFQQKDAAVETRKCPNCTAARPADSDLKFCDYCGYQFY